MYADDAIGNVTGSNSVNVFLGQGIPWLIGAIYTSAAQGGRGYYVKSDSLGFSVVVFLVCAIICIVFLMIRRYVVTGELGGETFGRVGSMVFLIGLWGVYITLCCL